MIELAATRSGLTIDDVKERFGVGRRTAERLLGAVRRVVDVEEVPATDGRRKRWRVRALPPVFAQLSADELAALDLAAERFVADGMSAHAHVLATLAGKLKSRLEDLKAARIDTDLDALLEAEGFASRPGPRPEIDPEVLGTLRHAVMARQRVELHYRYRTREGETRVVVHPYGFLYGARHYLVAWSEAEGSRAIRQYALPNILSARLVEGGFVPVEGFSLDRFTREMFGVFREEPSDVVWRFSAQAAADARQFRFHPDQRVRELPDGRVEVTFRAGGLREMAWHLFRWGAHVEVVSPPGLRLMLVDMLREALAAHAEHAPSPEPAAD